MPEPIDSPEVAQLRERAIRSASRMAEILRLKAPRQVIRNEIELLNQRTQALLEELDRTSN